MISDIMHIVAHERANPSRGGDAKPPVRRVNPGSGATEVSRDSKPIRIRMSHYPFEAVGEVVCNSVTTDLSSSRLGRTR